MPRTNLMAFLRALGLALALLAPAAMPARAQMGPPGPPTVGVVAAQTRAVTESQEFTGRIQAAQRVEVVARVTAFIAERLFTEGGEVAAGDLLFRLDRASFAAEVARGLPTAVTLACKDEAVAEALVHAIGLPTFRPYYSSDLVGAEIGGAVKNVLAIACGIVEGKKFGDSARAALTTRGFAELTRLGLAMGARTETLMGLSGLGDLILTCNSTKSRNMSLGLALGEGKSLDEIMGARNSVSEGVHSATAVVALARKHKIEMPIAEAVAAIVTGASTVDDAVGALLARPFRSET
jgi:glycerol-3-phosphate dehydrogenase (NAD(P)+)